MEQLNEANTTLVEKKKKWPLIVSGVILVLLLAGYGALCALAASSEGFFPNYQINGVEVGGLTAEQAAQALERELPARSLDLHLPEVEESGVKTDPEGSPLFQAEPVCSATFEELGVMAGTDCAALADRFYRDTHRGLLVDGWSYLMGLLRLRSSGFAVLEPDAARFTSATDRLAEELSIAPADTSYTLGEDIISITKAKNGLDVGAAGLRQAILDTLQTADSGVSVPATVVPAQVLTAQELYDQVAGKMKNAGFDPETKTIYPETVGAEFDADEAQRLLDMSGPGATVEVPAVIEFPKVTAEALRGVLFRDVLGTYTTHVGGSSGRVGNVRLSSGSINGYILNSGEVFSYNQVVGKRTEANGYRPAPAYVKGETVDEIGGGICQTSSTLYMATLLSNLEIVTRAAHRYVPAYIPKGMDATVSWGGPEYEFRNNTDYPIKITASVSPKNYLTISIYGTKTDDTYVKITNEVLGSTPSQVVYQDDPTLPAGTEKVKQSPYTGYKVRTYRNIYSGDGKLLSSTFEASSDYKARDKIILKGPLPVVNPSPDIPETPVTPGETETPVTPPSTGETGTTPPDTGEPGTTSPATGETGGETPVSPGGTDEPLTPPDAGEAGATPSGDSGGAAA